MLYLPANPEASKSETKLFTSLIKSLYFYQESNISIILIDEVAKFFPNRHFFFVFHFNGYYVLLPIFRFHISPNIGSQFIFFPLSDFKKFNQNASQSKYADIWGIVLVRINLKFLSCSNFSLSVSSKYPARGNKKGLCWSSQCHPYELVEKLNKG